MTFSSTSIRPTLLFHVGDPKTGTSSIQRALWERSARHRSTTYKPWIELNAMDLSKYFLKKPDHKPVMMSELQSWLQGCKEDLAVVSSEFFTGVPPRQLRAAIDRELPDFAEQCRVIAYVRPHSSRYLASYVQRSKSGVTIETPDSFFDAFSSMKMHQYTYRFRRWRRNFRKNFTLRPFIRRELLNNDIVDDFFGTVFGDSNFKLERRISENTSITDVSLAALLCIQNELISSGLSGHLRAMAGSTIANFYLPSLHQRGDKPWLAKQTVEKIYNLTAEDAQELDSRFFRRPLMFPELQKAVEQAQDLHMEVDVAAHFSMAQVSEIKLISGHIAEQIQKCSSAWSLHARHQQNLIELSFAQQALLLANRRALSELDVLFEAAAELIAD